MAERAPAINVSFHANVRRPLHGSTRWRVPLPNQPGGRLKRGIFRSVAELRAAIRRSLDDDNAKPRPVDCAKTQRKSYCQNTCRGSMSFDKVDVTN